MVLEFFIFTITPYSKDIHIYLRSQMLVPCGAGTPAREMRTAEVKPAGRAIFKSRKNDNSPPARRDSRTSFPELQTRSKAAGKSSFDSAQDRSAPHDLFFAHVVLGV